jgi:two-component system, OmpR family, response regulator VanR
MEQVNNENKTSVCANAGQGTRRRVLVVEDNKNVQNVLSRMISSMGFEVALADNGLEALAVFLDGSFDLVLTDLQMPTMDGSSLAHFVKEMSPNTPVILLTGADRETVWKKAKSESIDSVIFKPFKIIDFEKTVQGALESRKAEHGITRPV